MSINFGARVRLNGSVMKNIPLATGGLSSGAATAGAGTVSIGAASVVNTAGSAANTVGSAFSAKASGINSSGIVPAVVESATPYATPATIASSKAHPSLMGTFFSAVGQFFNSLVKVHVKNPSR